MSFAYLHRGWNRQPEGGVNRLGGFPGIASSRWRAPMMLGEAPSKPFLYGGNGRLKMFCPELSSTICPADITALRFATLATTDPSLEMMRIGLCLDFLILR